MTAGTRNRKLVTVASDVLPEFLSMTPSTKSEVLRASGMINHKVAIEKAI